MRTVMTGLSLLLACTLPAMAQQADILSRDLYEDRVRNEGNAITFCYNPFGSTAEFDQALAGTIGDALLAEVRLRNFLEGDLQQIPTAHDYRIPLATEQLFLLLVEHCDAFMGFLVNDRNPDWISVTRPYLTAGTVMFSADPEATTLAQTAREDGTLRIGTRMSASGDAQLISWLNTRSNPGWRRVPYHDNQLVFERVVDGTNSAGMIWEPGFVHATTTVPEYADLHAFTPPFQVRDINIGIATRAQDTYLNRILSDAIAALEADGTIAALLVTHHLRAPDGD